MQELHRTSAKILIPSSEESHADITGPDESSSGRSARTYLLVYFCAGVAATLTMQQAAYQGGAKPSTLLPVLTTYVGMALVYFMPDKDEDGRPKVVVWWSADDDTPSQRIRRARNNRKIMLLACFGMLANVLTYTGLALAGSAVFQVVFSSITVCTAVLSRVVLRKHLSTLQWGSILLVTLGLMATSVSLPKGGQTVELSAEEREAETVVFWGFCATLAAAFTFATQFIMFEKMLRQPDKEKLELTTSLVGTSASQAPAHKPPTSFETCVKTGVFASCVVGVYQLAYTLPNMQTLLADEIASKQGSPTYVFWLYVLFTLENVGMNWAYFGIMATSGAISAGICQSVRAVAVFLLSHVLFCPLHAEQCFTYQKAVGVVLVVVGVLSYAKLSMSSKS